MNDEPIIRADPPGDGQGPGDQIGQADGKQILSPREFQELFAERFAAAVAGAIQPDLAVRPAGWKRQPYGQFVSGLQEPNCSFLLTDAERDHFRVWLEMPHGPACVMVDALLGDSGEAGADETDRPLTSLDSQLLRRLIDLAAGSVGQPWLTGTSAGPALRGESPAAGDTEDDGRGDSVLVFAFDLTVGSRSGRMRLCAPQSLFGPDAAAQRDGPGGPVELSAALPDMSVSPNELAGLACGDIVTTDSAGDEEIIVRIAGIPKYRARLGICNGRRAITITGPITDNDGLAD